MLAILVGHGTSSVTNADDGGGLQLSEATVGVQGQYQVGRWTAVTGTVQSDIWPVEVAVRVSDPDGNLTRFPIDSVSGSSSGSATFSGLFKAGRLDGVIRLDLQTDNATKTITLQADTHQHDALSSSLHAWTHQTQFWATLGDTAAFPEAVERINTRSSHTRLPIKLIELSGASEIPALADALHALDVLVINGPQEIPSAINDAIRRWVLDGGHLVISMSKPQELADTTLDRWLPLRVLGESRLRNLSPLTLQVPGSVPMRVGEVEAIRFEMDYGEAIAATLDGPLWARMPYGFGRVTFLGVALSRRPLQSWGSLPLLCELLADSPHDEESSLQRTATAQLSQIGVSDLQTQLASGLDLFTQVRQPSTWMVMGSIALFLIVIGPLDYLIVHKLLRRPHWTWITFPVLVLVAAGAVVEAARQRYATGSLANQVDLVDLDTATGSTRVRSLISFTSPQSARYRVDAAQSGSDSGAVIGSPTGSLRLSWTGIPETGFRGMYRERGLDLAKPPYSFSSQLDSILDLPIGQWSSANVTVDGMGSHQSPDEIVDAQLRDEAGGLRGTVTNRLPLPLHDWFLAYQGRVYIPETRASGEAAYRIAPGEVLNLSDHRRVEERFFKHYFVGLRNYRVRRGNKVGQDSAAARDVYDPLDRDPYTILRMVSFYRACDLREFTSLSNRSLHQLDFSVLLPLDRAVLFCRLDEPAITFSVNETPVHSTEHTTILRVVIPVQNP